MIKRKKRSMRKRGLLALAVGVAAMAIGPCANVQNPPPGTQTFFGIAINFG